MDAQIESWRVQQYASNVYIQAQQEGSRLGSVVRSEEFTGKSEFFDRLGLAEAEDGDSRNPDTPNLSITHSRRMVTATRRHWGTLVDRVDKLQNIHDPESEYAIAAQNALGRKMDRILIQAAVGTARTGEDGTGSATLGTGQRVVPVSGGAQSKINVQALRKTKLIMDQNEVMGRRFMVITAGQLENLLSETETTSSDYAAVKALVKGELDTFMGFDFIRTELVEQELASTNFSGHLFNTSTGLYDAGGSAIDSTSISCFAFAEQALLLGKNPGAIARVTERDDKSYSNQVYAAMHFGAVRMEEEAVVAILALP